MVEKAAAFETSHPTVVFGPGAPTQKISTSTDLSRHAATWAPILFTTPSPEKGFH